MKFNIWKDCLKVPITELLSFIVDNRGKTVPTANDGWKLIATNCVTNNTLFPVYEKVRYLTQETYETWFRACREIFYLLTKVLQEGFVWFRIQ